MKRALVGKEDIMQAVREITLSENMQQVEQVFMERNGRITIIKKEIW